MGMVKNWVGLNRTRQTGQRILHDIGWQTITVRRSVDTSKNVGVDTELDDEVMMFSVQARIDPMDSKDSTKFWIGMVLPHVLPMMSKHDEWLVQGLDEAMIEYRVVSVGDEDVLLELV